ncbi:TadE/TadG family type IV pilus assembly protein [Aurantiacibacter suaedae]|uniref:TadE/TadG family type IV pilus assembly protein n=1 Tax=Aurantiacibacter suaedae TaxID=2545755 RepID=UPI0010F50A57|nr:pilus assembly protein [Aurantiacibacter suaedae]
MRLTLFVFWRRLLRDTRATAMLEFALSAPLLLSIGLFGAEAANRAITQMRVNQIAVLVADNASRVGENSLLGEVSIYESDINDIFIGADIQAGERFALLDNGRIILSSLEVLEESEDQQYIHWQRCMGDLDHPSSYGKEGDGEFSNMEGMGPPGEEIYAFRGEAVMFVEVAMTYQPIAVDLFDASQPIVAIAAFNVRNNRDLSGVKQRNANAPDPIANCGA